MIHTYYLEAFLVKYVTIILIYCILNFKSIFTPNLGIQSDVPGEVSEVAHQIVRLSRVDGIDFKVSEVHIGLAGDCIEPNSEEDDEKVPDLVTLQGKPKFEF